MKYSKQGRAYTPLLFFVGDKGNAASHIDKHNKKQYNKIRIVSLYRFK